MSFSPRKWTLEELHAERCEDVGECWEWAGAMSGRKKQMPIIKAHGKVWQAHVFSWLLSKHIDEKPECLLFWRGCLNFRCVNPAHIKTGSKKQMTAFLSERGALKRSPESVARVTAARRAQPTKLTIDKARSIRASDEPSRFEAAKHGCAASLISRIRAGRAWREGVTGSSIFNMGAA